ncbi:hypothetical protein OEZ85_012272 [Tetradesmus obliquus]|uniref:RING-type domain-containing protein n=1 Tax=Tetradesmus obliquus TaxID=3088 RepID=A0ABY8TUY3_TETOB|nr:hypothetical protein OEZ85_012272 [Tetradesmus obliquus]
MTTLSGSEFQFTTPQCPPDGWGWVIVELRDLAAAGADASSGSGASAPGAEVQAPEAVAAKAKALLAECARLRRVAADGAHAVFEQVVLAQAAAALDPKDKCNLCENATAVATAEGVFGCGCHGFNFCTGCLVECSVTHDWHSCPTCRKSKRARTA